MHVAYSGRMFTVADARELARAKHAGQVDKQGRDYFEAHLVPIAAALAPFGPLAEMAGWLHDIVEDTDTSLDDLRALGVPEIVVEAIDAVSRRPGEHYLRGLIPRSAAHPLGRLVKLADNRHNLNSNAELAETDPAKAKSLREGRYLPARRELLAAEAANERRVLA